MTTAKYGLYLTLDELKVVSNSLPDGSAVKKRVDELITQGNIEERVFPTKEAEE